MWLLTPLGYFSIFQSPSDVKEGSLTVGSRSRSDLETLRDRYLPTLSAIDESRGEDHDFIAVAPREAVIVAVVKLLLDLDYASVRQAVALHNGPWRAEVYGQVAELLQALPERATAAGSGEESPDMGGGSRYGGVLIDEHDRVLLRRPAGGEGAIAWTFAETTSEAGRRPETIALNAVYLQTGYRAQIMGTLPGPFADEEGETHFFLLKPVGMPGSFDRSRTAVVEWVPVRDAPRHIERTSDPARRMRDAAVLLAAISANNRNRRAG
jgi:hypothetical protein